MARCDNTKQPAKTNFSPSSSHEFDVTQQSISSVDPSDDETFQDANNNDRPSGYVIVEQLQNIHSCKKGWANVYVKCQVSGGVVRWCNQHKNLF